MADLMRPIARSLVLLIPATLLPLAAWVSSAQDGPQARPGLRPDQARALGRISADSLKGHLSFLASDLLEGRETPSRGLDLAAEYIAAQFRRAGLEPVGDDGYFQTADWVYVEPDPSSFRLDIAVDGQSTRARGDRVGVRWLRAHEIARAGLFKADYRASAGLEPGQVAGRAVVVEYPDVRRLGGPQGVATRRSIAEFKARMAALKPAMVVNIVRAADEASGVVPRLLDPRTPSASEPSDDDPSGPPALSVHDPEIIALLDAIPPGQATATASCHLDEPTRRPVKLRNVVGLLRGSDPALKDTCVMVTAHYDHLGVRGPAGPDRIFNGANDDGSGTVSVVEIASALGTLERRPRRSILFATFFGEEHGLLGSRYLGRHPVVPVEKTVADLNLEQVGRTDDAEGPQVARASLTGFGYSDVSTTLAAAGEAEGVKVVKHPRNSDLYFGRSDNQALADLGVPAHTLCVAFEFPDYHGAADHWDKLDYPNMARVDRMVARALLAIADDPNEPKWDEANPKAAKYLKAWKDRRAK